MSRKQSIYNCFVLERRSLVPKVSDLLSIQRIQLLLLSFLWQREGSLRPADTVLIVQRFRFDFNNQYQIVELDLALTETAGRLVGQDPL